MKTRNWIIILTLALEAFTCLLRFGLKLESTRDTEFLSTLTFGMRIHHSYLGILLVLLVMNLDPGSFSRRWGWRIAWALVASDLIHHFLVLWPITGDPQFHLYYAY